MTYYTQIRDIVHYKSSPSSTTYRGTDISTT
jgi:hypothetical protein